MKSLRLLLVPCAALAILAGCGGSQPPIGAQGVMPQTSTIAQHAEPGKTWMLPEARRKDLLYIAESNGYVYVFTYPGGTLINQFGANASGGLCSDKQGNIFVTDYRDEELFEYAHGGTSPIAILHPDAQPRDCSVDPASGNLATVNLDYNDTSSVSIFKNASGSPTKYTDPGTAVGGTCSYDDAGNLYVSAGTSSQPFLIAELPAGGSVFSNIAVNGDFRGGNFLQWDGSHIAVTNAHPKMPVIVSQVEVAGSMGSVVGTTTLTNSYAYVKYFWIQNNTIITSLNGGGPKARKIGLWRYPAGGKPSTIITMPKGQGSPGVALGITVSVAPRH